MGADFLFQTLPACNLTQERVAALKLLATTTKLDRDQPDGDFEEDVEWRRALVKAVENLAWPYQREVGRWNPTPTNPLKYAVWITAGMSWGDAPTESYREFEWLQQYRPIHELLLKWAEEDAA